MILAWGAAASAAPTVGGVLRPELAIDLPGEKNQLPGEFSTDVNTFGRAFARDETQRGDLWFFEARFQHHAWFPQGAEGLGETEGWWDMGLGETGFDGKLGGPVRLRIGALVERWGKLDLLPVADVINPRDGRSGLMTPLEYQKIPVPMATVVVGNDTFRSKTSLIPFSTADRLWLRETDWSYVRQGWTDAYLSSIKGWRDPDGDVANGWNSLVTSLRLSQQELGPSLRRGLDQAVNGKNIPEALLVNGEIAQRFELRLHSLDLAVMGGLLRSRQPQTALDPAIVDFLKGGVAPSDDDIVAFQQEVVQPALQGGPLDVSWPRTAVVGADGSALVGPVQVRGEAMWQSHRVVRQPWGQSTTVPQLGAGLGLDYFRGSSFQLTLEARWLHLFDPPAKMVLSLPDQVQLAGGLRWSFVRDQVFVQLGGAYDVSFAEGLVRPTVGVRATDWLQLELGAVVLGGLDTPPPAGLEEALTYQGGPLSYWSQNDAITFAVSLIR
ncbi:MAG: hypothetical protein R3F59_06820 [Myxococcota bacterium]